MPHRLAGRAGEHREPSLANPARPTLQFAPRQWMALGAPDHIARPRQSRRLLTAPRVHLLLRRRWRSPATEPVQETPPSGLAGACALEGQIPDKSPGEPLISYMAVVHTDVHTLIYVRTHDSPHRAECSSQTAGDGAGCPWPRHRRHRDVPL